MERQAGRMARLGGPEVADPCIRRSADRNDWRSIVASVVSTPARYEN